MKTPLLLLSAVWSVRSVESVTNQAVYKQSCAIWINVMDLYVRSSSGPVLATCFSTGM